MTAAEYACGQCGTPVTDEHTSQTGRPVCQNWPDCDVTTKLIDHLQQAAEQVRQANHTSYSASSATIPELYHVIGGLVGLVQKIPQQIGYLYDVVTQADESWQNYYHDNGDDGDVAFTLDDARSKISHAYQLTIDVSVDLHDAWRQLGHIGVRAGDQ